MVGSREGNGTPVLGLPRASGEGRFSTDVPTEGCVRKLLKNKALHLAVACPWILVEWSKQRARFELHRNYTGGGGRYVDFSVMCPKV